MTTQTIDETKVEEFVGKALGDAGSATTVVLAVLGARLGLFRDLAERGPATSATLAERAGIAERYAREWLGGMAAAGYLDYDPDTGDYTLPAERAPVLAQEAGPVFFGGVYEMLAATLAVLDPLTEAFRTGNGVAMSAYPDEWWNGLERFTAGWFENLLVPIWLPEMPAVQAKLDAGADVADIGCGNGRALIRLAQAYPASRYVGYDLHGPNVERARRAAEEAGVAERIRFEQRDVVAGLPDDYDVIFTFDVIHDAADPAGLLRVIREALQPDGRYVCVDINASHVPEENVGPLAAFFYGFSILYCMTTSLSQGGAALGTLGFNPHVARQMCGEAGFTDVRVLPLDNPFNHVYEVRAD
jgi:SAM-dependent methyltransferase